MFNIIKKYKNKYLLGIAFVVTFSIGVSIFFQPTTYAATNETFRCSYKYGKEELVCKMDKLESGQSRASILGEGELVGSAADGTYTWVDSLSGYSRFSNPQGNGCPQSTMSDYVIHATKGARKGMLYKHVFDYTSCHQNPQSYVTVIINTDEADSETVKEAGSLGSNELLKKTFGSELNSKLKRWFCAKDPSVSSGSIVDDSLCAIKYEQMIAQCGNKGMNAHSQAERGGHKSDGTVGKQAIARCLRDRTDVSYDEIYEKIEKLDWQEFLAKRAEAEEKMKNKIAEEYDEEDCIAEGLEWDDETGCEDPNASSCVVDPLGFVICPVVNFLASMADKAYEFIAESLLEIPPSTFTSSPSAANPSSSALLRAWQAFQTIANSILVVLFLIIIMSQMTSIGISNYGLKKIMPRLVMMAILINASYIICMLAVDLSNILGYGLKDIFNSMSENIGRVDDPSAYRSYHNAGSAGGGFGDIALGVLAGGAVGTVGALAVTGSPTIILALVALIPVVIGALIALIMIFLILVARHAIIILLIAISPVAFAMNLLPNTASLFKKWSKLFITLLMVFPIIGLVYGASALASTIMSEALFLEYQAGEDPESLKQIMSAAVMVLPFFAVPTILKKSLDSLGNISGKVNSSVGNLKRGMSENLKKSDAVKYNKQKQNLNRANAAAGIGNSPRARLNRRMAQIGAGGSASDSKFNQKTRQFVGNKGRPSGYAQYKDDQAWGTQLEAAQEAASGMSRDDLLEMAMDGGAGGAERYAALESLKAQGGLSTNEEYKLAASLPASDSKNNIRLNNAAKGLMTSPITGSPKGLQAIDNGNFGTSVKSIYKDFAKNRATQESVAKLSGEEMKDIYRSISSDAELSGGFANTIFEMTENSRLNSNLSPEALKGANEVIDRFTAP